MKKLIYILFVLITIAFVVAAIAGFATGRINPEGVDLVSRIGVITGIGGQSMSFLDVVCL